MLEVIERNFEGISKIREKRFGIKFKKRDDPKDKLLQRYKIYQFKNAGMSYVEIAIALEKSGLVKEMTEDNIRKILNEIRSENKKFNLIAGTS